MHKLTFQAPIFSKGRQIGLDNWTFKLSTLSSFCDIHSQHDDAISGYEQQCAVQCWQLPAKKNNSYYNDFVSKFTYTDNPVFSSNFHYCDLELINWSWIKCCALSVSVCGPLMISVMLTFPIRCHTHIVTLTAQCGTEITCKSTEQRQTITYDCQ